MSLGKKLYASVLSAFVIFAAILILFQQNREKAYRQEALNSRLQEYNFRMYCGMAKGLAARDAADSLVAHACDVNLRITVVKNDGQVYFDNKDSVPSLMDNHLERKEISQALESGTGHDCDRQSKTLNRKYFYSATYFPTDSIVVRTALPYDADLTNMLRGDPLYLWFTLGVLAILTAILWRFLNRLAVNISKLRAFANSIGKDGELRKEGDGQFPNDELGYVANKIVKLYDKLQETRRQQDILKRQLTQNIAHELKTPVASIHGYIETLLSNPDMDRETHKQFMERCYAQTNRLASLIQDISTLNRLDNADNTHSFESVSINAIVDNIRKETDLQLEGKGMRFANNLPQGVTINGDKSLVYSIFRNLTDNAIAYAGHSATIELRAHETRQSWFFEFSDNGIGVADEHLPRLFERFYRVDKGRSRSNGGTGLGLAIVKNAVAVHGGTIKVTNRKGGGLTFLFSLRKHVQHKELEKREA